MKHGYYMGDINEPKKVELIITPPPKIDPPKPVMSKKKDTDGDGLDDNAELMNHRTNALKIDTKD
ncbi:MAG: hypothetical protein PHO32_04060 [Candidatus Cloacimonetes bacterium]|nr:hypothetical protein [Candidatus Cloacimonadota bacterium]